MDKIFDKRMGWRPDLPDFRDYTVENENVKPLMEKIGISRPVKEIPATVDLKKWCSPIEDQNNLGSCTANAGVGLVEYFECKAFGKHVDASRLFLYKTTRRLMGLKGDSGAELRTTMAAMVLFGVPPEKYWPYTDKTHDFDKEPDTFCYACAENYKSIQYLRLDHPSSSKNEILDRIKTNLAAGLPSMFGFTVYNSIEQTMDNYGKIPFPCGGEQMEGGHAIVAVGYNDRMKIKNDNCGTSTTGALLIRNSWGTGWGNKGYGWLPYDYVLKGLATDWWTLLKNEWVDTGEFGL
jgi:C1A family cysteine protease